MSAGTITFIEAGATQVTDLGRRRGPRYGVPVNGALDQRSARIANILVGNADEDPLLEITALDVEFVPDVDVLLAVAGADGDLTVDDVTRPSNQPVSVRAGQTVALRHIQGGLRAYLAVRGSFEVPRLLGSCAPDSVLGFGGRVANAAAIAVRRSTAPIFNDHFTCELYCLDVPRRPAGFVVDVTDGPDIDDFAGTADRLFAQPYLVTPTSNHIGLRMTGPLPERVARGEVLSRGVPVGAVEVPPGDELLVLHRGRGVTAGYPVLAVVTSRSLDTLAQVRPGQRLRFRRVSAADAAARARADRVELDALRLQVRSVFTALDALSTATTGRTLS
ncbi:biotin-dependent carboxyltransferase family protein [Microbacterium capsulatum]|uniref:Biotin-dependent carboxyltransferase family protein n=1 Tax=Microbacterium capsulatum TaxID=3041921 RepID=A0ABU0XJ39_9MICO|nr:biotin-dependent carboxyltransferase family protein [Microbacterium sp. ASV81]MDQ4215156.1 biotin-dependent carboxyltransferase family protein [Microbacterium sp. ASV81]